MNIEKAEDLNQYIKNKACELVYMCNSDFRHETIKKELEIFCEDIMPIIHKYYTDDLTLLQKRQK